MRRLMEVLRRLDPRKIPPVVNGYYLEKNEMVKKLMEEK